MAGGCHDSSLTRVQPTFDQLYAYGGRCGDVNWLNEVLRLASRGHEILRYDVGVPLAPIYESTLYPPRALLEFYLNNPERLSWPVDGSVPRKFSKETNEWRLRLLARDIDARTEGIRLLGATSSTGGKKWFIFEGITKADAFLTTSMARSVLIEGKRTENKLTGFTDWDRAREQVYRNLDAGYDQYGDGVLQLVIVQEGSNCEAMARELDRDGWERAARSMPHRSNAEVKKLWTERYAGWTTWEAIQRRYPFLDLPNVMP
jgi:hypothetical protein